MRSYSYYLPDYYDKYPVSHRVLGKGGYGGTPYEMGSGYHKKTIVYPELNYDYLSKELKGIFDNFNYNRNWVKYLSDEELAQYKSARFSRRLHDYTDAINSGNLIKQYLDEFPHYSDRFLYYNWKTNKFSHYSGKHTVDIPFQPISAEDMFEVYGGKSYKYYDKEKAKQIMDTLYNVALYRGADHRRNFFSLPDFTNKDILRYHFYSGAFDGKLFYREKSNKLYVNDEYLNEQFRTISKIQDSLGLKENIRGLIDFNSKPETSDVYIGDGLPSKSGKSREEIIYRSRQDDEIEKIASGGNYRAEVIPANRVSSKFFDKHPEILRYLNKIHGNLNGVI